MFFPLVMPLFMEDMRRRAEGVLREPNDHVFLSFATF